MTQIPILAGVYAQQGPDFERSYPLNLVPNVEETGISNGYLRSAPGIVATGTGQGADGGGIEWNGTLYRASGTKLISVAEDGSTLTVGTLGGTGQASFAYSFDQLAVARALNLFLYDGTTFQRVTDVDLGDVLDVIWIDGYFMTTDGTSLVVTELNDPTQVDPLKYGSSEADPDDIMGLGERRGEAIAFNRNTIEFFFNAGTTGFPFTRNRGAQIDKGIVGTHAKCRFLDTYAFVGNARGEKPRVYLIAEGAAQPISNRTLDKALSALTADELSGIILEARHGDGIQELYVHLPAVTFVYSHNASQALELPVWYRLASGSGGDEPYRGRNFVLAYGDWHCGDLESSALGRLDGDTAAQFGETPGWAFDASLVYSGGTGAICHELELVGFYGRAAPGAEPRMFMSWTDDGLTYSQERSARTGYSGQRRLRVAWRKNGRLAQWRSFRFRSVSDVPVSFSRLEAALEQLGG